MVQYLKNNDSYIYLHHISSVMSDQELVQNTDLHKQTKNETH